MIEESILKKLSYFSLMSLLRYGDLSNEDIMQIRKIALARPINEKKFYQLFQKRSI